jgi:hypothetical protein
MKTSILVILSLLVAGHGAAHAEPDTWHPTGATMDHWGTEALAASLELGGVRLTPRAELDDGPRYGLHATFYAQAGGQVAKRVRLGVYGALPAGYLSSDFQTGNPAVGGMATITVARGTEILLHGGRSFRTGELYDLNSVPGNTGAGRVAEQHLHTPGSAWLRVGSSLLHRSDRFFGRLDLGLDMYLDNNDGALDSLWRVNVAAGTPLDAFVLLAELASVIKTQDDFDDRAETTVALTAHMPRETVSPYLGLVLPIDSVRRELDLAIVGGARLTMPE